MENTELQDLIINRVLNEMNLAEEFATAWNASWSEQLTDCYNEDLYHLGGERIKRLQDKYGAHYIMPNIYNKPEINGLPLRTETLADDEGKEFICEFRQIDWVGMNSHKAEREFSFKNNGDIHFTKTIKTRNTNSNRTNDNVSKKREREISYNSVFNVLSGDFSLEINMQELIPSTKKAIYPGSRPQYKSTIYHISLTGTLLRKKVGDIEIIEDLSSGFKSISIAKGLEKKDRQNNASVVFEATLNPDNSLEAGAVAINTYKKNGKINGNYRFDVSRKKGIRANFYSRKGVKIDLMENPSLLESAKNLLPDHMSENTSNQLIKGFASSTETTIAKNLANKTISFDTSDFNMSAVIEADKKIIDLIKCIKGEIPLSGLRDRIDYCIELMNREKRETIVEKPKVLTLESTIIE
ncbi:MAG: hypothetical protein J1F35_07140 [Erysipelotrichales bacterium]|nr:hypothetical protein [Erysipelotrichales bacterium]